MLENPKYNYFITLESSGADDEECKIDRNDEEKSEDETDESTDDLLDMETETSSIEVLSY
jgi:hypothetical protein